jgi:hypothetical protein
MLEMMYQGKGTSLPSESTQVSRPNGCRSLAVQYGLKPVKMDHTESESLALKSAHNLYSTVTSRRSRYRFRLGSTSMSDRWGQRWSLHMNAMTATPDAVRSASSG